MGTGDDDAVCCGCFPWGRRRRSGAAANRRPSSSAARSALRPANSVKLRGILKTTAPEPGPAKWRSTAGTSETSSAGSVRHGDGTESVNGTATYITATTFSSGDGLLPAAVNPALKARSCAADVQVRGSSQSRLQAAAATTPALAGNGSAFSHPASKASINVGPSKPMMQVELSEFGGSGAAAAVAASALPPAAVAAAPGASTAGAAAGKPQAVARLAELQERYRQRAGAGGGGGSAVVVPAPEAADAAAAVDDGPRTEHMQCDSFTCNASVYGRYTGDGTPPPPRLTLLPPLPYSPAGQGGGGGYGRGGGSAAAAARDPRRLYQTAYDLRLRTPLLDTISPDISRHSSVTSAHIPGSLPSVTQRHASPGAKRIYVAAPLWDEGLVTASPPPQAAAAARPALISWSGPEHSAALPPPAPRRSSNPTAAWGGGALYGRHADQEGAMDGEATALGGGRSSGVAAYHSSQSSQQPLSRPSVAATVAVRALAAAAAATPSPRQSNTGGVAHRTAHGPAGYSSAAMSARNGVASPGGRQMSKLPPGTTTGLRGADVGMSALAAAVELLDRTEGLDTFGGGGSPAQWRRESGKGDGGLGRDPQQPIQFQQPLRPPQPPPQPQQHHHHQLEQQQQQLEQQQLQRIQLEDPRVDAVEARSPRSDPATSKRMLAGGDGAGVTVGVCGGGGADIYSEASGNGNGVCGGGGGMDEPVSYSRLAMRPSQMRAQAALANEEMLAALIGSSRKAFGNLPSAKVDGRGVVSELEQFDRVQDAMRRLESIMAATPPPPVPLPPPPPPPPPPPVVVVAPSRCYLHARAGTLEDATYDFAGSAPVAADMEVKPW